MKRMAGLLLALALLVVPFAVAEPVAANVVGGTADTQYTVTVTDQDINVEAGYTYETNLDIESITNAWAGLYGKITERYVLGANIGGTNYKFYEWTATTVTGYVYATTSTDINWTLLIDVTDANIAAVLNSRYGVTWNPRPGEGLAGTIDGQDSAGDYCSVTNAQYVLTYEDGGTKFWPTCFYLDGAGDDLVLEAKTDGDIGTDENSFRGTDADYQMLVPAVSGTQAVMYYIWKG